MAETNRESTLDISEEVSVCKSPVSIETHLASMGCLSNAEVVEELPESNKLQSPDHKEKNSAESEATVSKQIENECCETENSTDNKVLPEEESFDSKTDQANDKEADSKLAKVSEPAHESNDVVIVEEEEKLNEILKTVHNDLEAQNCEKSAGEEDAKNQESTANDEVSVEEPQKENSGEDAKEDVKQNPVESKITRLRRSSGEQKAKVSEEIEDSEKEVGIVGPPTVVSELINDEELNAEPTLSAEQKMQDHVAQWVEKSVKAKALLAADAEEENHVENDSRNKKKNLRDSRTVKKKTNDVSSVPTRKSQRIVSNIIKRSIKCLNKMHAMESAGGNGKKVDAAEKTKEEDYSRASPKVPQSQQNGAALPEETASGGAAGGAGDVDAEGAPSTATAAAAATTNRLRSTSIKKEPLCDAEAEMATKNHSSAIAESAGQKTSAPRSLKSNAENGRKRKSTDSGQSSANGNSAPKKFCVEQREQYITSLVGCEKITAEELAARADQLRAEVQALDELARAKEMEWNEILSMRKLKEEAYLRIERRRQVMGFMEGNGQLPDALPPASMALGPEWESSGNTTPLSKEKCGFESKEDLGAEENSEDSQAFKKEKGSKFSSQRQATPPKQGGENGSRKQQQQQHQSAEALSPENRQIGEGRQGAIVDVRSIIADYRLRHPETVPRRGRRMRNSVNVGLGAGGAMVETGHNVDSRPSSTDSCKSNPNAADPNNSMSFKDVLVQFAKLSQQQGEPVKTPQNYPDVTLHPVAPSAANQNTGAQQTGSLLHGILTKSQSPRPTTFSPTLARLLTAPERERNAPSATSIPQQAVTATHHLLQAYQGSNPVSISDLLSSSKARTEITITPVVNTAVQSHSNNLIHVDDVEEETAVIEDRESRVSSGGRDNREDRDSPPRCQGCHERAAQFVCAGCGNQWYCSRECQVAAWDEHSEVCSG